MKKDLIQYLINEIKLDKTQQQKLFETMDFGSLFAGKVSVETIKTILEHPIAREKLKKMVISNPDNLVDYDLKELFKEEPLSDDESLKLILHVLKKYDHFEIEKDEKGKPILTRLNKSYQINYDEFEEEERDVFDEDNDFEDEEDWTERSITRINKNEINIINSYLSNKVNVDPAVFKRSLKLNDINKIFYNCCANHKIMFDSKDWLKIIKVNPEYPCQLMKPYEKPVLMEAFVTLIGNSPQIHLSYKNIERVLKVLEEENKKFFKENYTQVCKKASKHFLFIALFNQKILEDFEKDIHLNKTNFKENKNLNIVLDIHNLRSLGQIVYLMQNQNVQINYSKILDVLNVVLDANLSNAPFLNGHLPKKEIIKTLLKNFRFTSDGYEDEEIEERNKEHFELQKEFLTFFAQSPIYKNDLMVVIKEFKKKKNSCPNIKKMELFFETLFLKNENLNENKTRRVLL